VRLELTYYVPSLRGETTTSIPGNTVATVVSGGVTDAELTRAKNIYAAAFWKQIATIDGKAALLGQFEVFEGDYKKLFDSPALYERVTRADVQKAAALIFQKNHRTVGVLQAPAAKPAAPAAATPEAKP